MKKSLMAASIASLAVAAMPVVGVFAEFQSSVTDTLTVNIPESCTIGTNNVDYPAEGNPTSENAYVVTMKNGQLREDIGGGTADGAATNDNTFTVTCNIADGNTNPNADTWKLTAQGLNGETSLVGKTDTTAEGEEIITGIEDSVSDWAFKITKASGDSAEYVGEYTDGFNSVPDIAEDVLSGSGEATLTTLYRVYIDMDQAPGTYEGGIVYTLTNPAS